jgi:hypothetical protein
VRNKLNTIAAHHLIEVTGGKGKQGGRKTKEAQFSASEVVAMLRQALGGNPGNQTQNPGAPATAPQAAPARSPCSDPSSDASDATASVVIGSQASSPR